MRKVPAAVVAATIALLVPWEGYQPVAHHDRIDPAGVITWCYGRTNYDDPTVKIGTRFTKKQCEELLAQADIPKYNAMVHRVIKVPMSVGTEAALTSFTYNVGEGTLRKSSVARKINAGNVRGGCEALMLYTMADGKRLQGLVNRRVEERKVCLS